MKLVYFLCTTMAYMLNWLEICGSQVGMFFRYMLVGSVFPQAVGVCPWQAWHFFVILWYYYIISAFYMIAACIVLDKDRRGTFSSAFHLIKFFLCLSTRSSWRVLRVRWSEKMLYWQSVSMCFAWSVFAQDMRRGRGSAPNVTQVLEQMIITDSSCHNTCCCHSNLNNHIATMCTFLYLFMRDAEI